MRVFLDSVESQLRRDAPVSYLWQAAARRRLYGIVEDGDLADAIDLAAVDQGEPPHLSARLRRR